MIHNSMNILKLTEVYILKGWSLRLCIWTVSHWDKVASLWGTQEEIYTRVSVFFGSKTLEASLSYLVWIVPIWALIISKTKLTKMSILSFHSTILIANFKSGQSVTFVFGILNRTEYCLDKCFLSVYKLKFVSRVKKMIICRGESPWYSNRRFFVKFEPLIQVFTSIK
jgi:hypothetical protein